ncbi:antimicrobial peptide NK-lysin-like [Acipenser oxyrinchus oxyrinchus]|uniref:Antimicrobial peptide NK-lysin-like n=1 Tax=Acipenser oxyrinchus oxyrinchus TaxID=40147 RepID=A0AAD8GDL6_ACIOX|nr:antimicrobial peptide NK-lysin-like [Acipenser oxyrinchus oxyrinchus]
MAFLIFVSVLLLSSAFADSGLIPNDTLDDEDVYFYKQVELGIQCKVCTMVVKKVEKLIPDDAEKADLINKLHVTLDYARGSYKRFDLLTGNVDGQSLESSHTGHL